MIHGHPAVAKRPPLKVPVKRVRSAIADRFRAGDSVALLAWDFNHTRHEIEFCIREAMKRKSRRGG